MLPTNAIQALSDHVARSLHKHDGMSQRQTIVHEPRATRMLAAMVLQKLLLLLLQRAHPNEVVLGPHHEAEAGGQVVVLQRRGVVVQDGEAVVRLDQEVIVHARVLQNMYPFNIA